MEMRETIYYDKFDLIVILSIRLLTLNVVIYAW